jgi:hypothetical protein
MACLGTLAKVEELKRDYWSPARGAKVDGSVGSNHGPATTDIKDAQLRGRFDLDALRGSAIIEIELPDHQD